MVFDRLQRIRTSEFASGPSYCKRCTQCEDRQLLEVVADGDFPGLAAFFGEVKQPLAAVMLEALDFERGGGADAGGGINHDGDHRPVT